MFESYDFAFIPQGKHKVGDKLAKNIISDIETVVDFNENREIIRVGVTNKFKKGTDISEVVSKDGRVEKVMYPSLFVVDNDTQIKDKHIKGNPELTMKKGTELKVCKLSWSESSDMVYWYGYFVTPDKIEYFKDGNLVFDYFVKRIRLKLRRTDLIG